MNAGPATVTRTYLEIADIAELRPPRCEPRRPFGLLQVADPALNRFFYEAVGADWCWIDRLGWSDRQWQRWATRVETWVIEVEGEPAGYFELEPGTGVVTIAYFGLRPPFQGLGIGAHALTAAIRRGFELAPRVAVNTATTDSPHALANYEARGMRVIRRALQRPAR